MIKVTEDGFVWLNVTNKAKELWNTGIFELYSLSESNDCEFLINNEQQLLSDAKNNNVWIEVGKLTKEHLYPFFKTLRKHENAI
jgi:hypothetical protein